MNEALLQLMQVSASIFLTGQRERQFQGLEASSPGISASHVKQGHSRGLRLKASFGQLYSLVCSRCSINI